MIRVHYAVLVAAVVFGSTPAQSQDWVQVGPPGGNVRALAADPREPQRIYLGSGDGILSRSEDGGLHWQRLIPGFPLRGCSLDQVVVDGRGVVFVGFREVGGSGGGVARSVDGGMTFTTLQGIDGESVRALALAPSDPEVIAAGTRTGVFLSPDGGTNWRRVTPAEHPDLRNVESLVFDPTDSRVLYAGTWHLGWKTVDGGATWNPMHEGMIDDSDVMSLTVDHRNPQVIFATACSGIYRSTDGAAQWTKLSGIPYSSRRTRAFAHGGDKMDLLFAGTTEGLWISASGGERWWRATPRDLVVNALLVQPDGTILLGAEGTGVLRSSDRGRTWVACNSGFSERFVSRLLFDPDGSRLFVAAWGDGGVFVTSGRRGPWTRVVEGMNGRKVLSLALLDGTVYAGTDSGIFARAPKATKWNRRATVLDGRQVEPRVTDLLALAPGRLLAATSMGLIESADGGVTWTRADLGQRNAVYALAGSPDDRDWVMAATPSGFYRSEDGGVTWDRVSIALRGVTPHTLAVKSSDGRVLFITTTGGLFRSDDQGTTWRRVAGGLPHSDLSGLAIHPDGRTMYASDFNWGGIFRSADGGVTWERMESAGLPSDRVWTLGLDPQAPERVFASSAHGLHLLEPVSVAIGDAGSL